MSGFSLIPKDESFFLFFEEAAIVAVKACATLQQMLDDIDNAEQYRAEIAELEHHGDQIIHKVMDKLNRAFITPLDAEDIRALSSRQDDIIDMIQAAAERIVLYRVKEATPASKELAKILYASVTEVNDVVTLLKSFKNKRAIVEKCIEINRLENAGDKVYREALGALFATGDLMELIRWKEIYEQIEQAMDECEDLADIIESIVVKHS